MAFYGNYGNFYQDNVYSVNAWQAFQFQGQNDLYGQFCNALEKNVVNKRRGALQAEELMNLMNNCPQIKNFFKVFWSRELCCVMIAMLDKSHDGFMQWDEFLELQQCLVAWFNCFKKYDYDGSGFIESCELINVITQLYGYQISKPCLTTLLKRYSRVYPGPNGCDERCLISFDDFVTVSVRLRAYTTAFRQKDSREHGVETGYAQYHYDDKEDLIHFAKVICYEIIKHKETEETSCIFIEIIYS